MVSRFSMRSRTYDLIHIGAAVTSQPAHYQVCSEQINRRENVRATYLLAKQRKMWETCVSSSWCKAEGTAILAIGGQMMKVGAFSEAKDWGSARQRVGFSWTRAG